MDPCKRNGPASAGMTLAARLRQIRGIDGGTRIGWRQNVVNAVAARAIRYSLAAAFRASPWNDAS